MTTDSIYEVYIKGVLYEWVVAGDSIVLVKKGSWLTKEMTQQ
jgi:hypothetical protein